MILKTIFFALATLLIATIVSGKLTGRIVGGAATSIKEYPYQISLQYTNVNGTAHICGGSIISSIWIITAAHCTYDKIPEELNVVAGTSFYDRPGTEIAVKRIIIHPNYDNQNLDYDISLLELSEKLNYNKTIQPIALPDDNEVVSDGTMCTITGWGDRKQALILFGKTQLRVAKVPLENHTECIKSYRMVNAVTLRMICAGFDQGGKSTCQGDSGGALACGQKLSGITSWGAGCAQPDSPGVYTNVQMLREWIRKQTGV